MFPLVVAMVFCWAIVMVFTQSAVTVVIRVLFTALGYGWSVFGEWFCCLNHLKTY